VLADESLDVTYELRMYAWTEQTTGTISLKGVVHDIVQKSARANQWPLSGLALSAGRTVTPTGFTGDVSPDINGSPTGENIFSAEISPIAYTPGSNSRTVNITAGIGQWNNAAGIG